MGLNDRGGGFGALRDFGGGAPGPQGDKGDKGDKGDAGLQLRYGSGYPPLSLGQVGEFYLDRTGRQLIGPKQSSTWGETIYLGPSQASGQPMWFAKSGVLTGTDGQDGQLGIDLGSNHIYRAKSGGAWPANGRNYSGGGRSESADFTVKSTDDQNLIVVDATAANRTVTLPSIASVLGQGFQVSFWKNSNNNVVTINRAAGDTFSSGETALTMNTDRDFVHLMGISNRWYLLSDRRMVHVYARNSTAQSIPRATWTRLALDSLVYNLGNAWSATGHFATLPYPGNYFITTRQALTGLVNGYTHVVGTGSDTAATTTLDWRIQFGTGTQHKAGNWVLQNVAAGFRTAGWIWHNDTVARTIPVNNCYYIITRELY